MVTGPTKPNNDAPEGWIEPQRILVILAHPDDPEFFCGGSIARWASLGHEIHYCLLTRGDKGTQDRNLAPVELMRIREQEEWAAAAILGVRSVCFLGFEDGYLQPSLEARREVTRVIRQVRPDVVVTCDPGNYFPRENNLNHPDHRAAGEIVLGAVYPAAGNHLFFPELIAAEQLDTHPIKELWITLTHQPNTVLDVTPFWEKRLEALCAHKSQIGDPALLRERVLSRRVPGSPLDAPRFEDKFRRLVFG